MNAIGFKTSLPIEAEESLFLFQTDKPLPKSRDLLVKVIATGVNPVDYKVRERSAIDTTLDVPTILGWDAVGRVEEIGSEVKEYKKGDIVYYAGDITRPGTNAEFQLIDERIAGHKPETLTNAEAAVLPLTTLTAWESIFDKLKIEEGGGNDKTVLVIGGAGGVGSMAIQILKKLTETIVIATASRRESIAWCKQLGADEVVNHHHLVAETKNIVNEVDYILNFADTSQHWQSMIELIKPMGHICSIVETMDKPVSIDLLQPKSITFSYEFMFTRSMFQTEDIERQREILNKVSHMVDTNQIVTTLNYNLNGFTVENFKEAHAKLASRKMIGKIAITY